MHRLLSATVLAAALLTTAAAFGQTQTYPATFKYNDSGVKNATGRSGDASIETRTLLGRDGVATLELTANGAVEKVQAKMPDQSVVNFNDTDGSGSFTAALGTLAWHAPVAIEAHVASATGDRTEVVDASDVVKRRPDLRVNSVIAPVHALVGFPTIVRVSLSELNGETGAHTNVRVLANGSEVDRIDGIWVDAGDTVNVSLATVFESAGPTDLQVIADGVNPGDWDDSNNSGTAQTQVYDDADPFYSWDATAHEDTTTTSRSSLTSSEENHYDGGGTTQHFHLDAQTAAHANLSSLNATVSAESDGTTVIPELTAGDWNVHSSPFSTCADSTSPGVEVVVCNDKPGTRFYRTDRSQVTVDFGNSGISYHSWGYNKDIRDPNSPTGYATVDVTYIAPNTVTPLGTTATMHVMLSDGTTLWKADPFFDSFTTSYTNVDQPYQCSSGWFGTSCAESHVHGVARDARTSNQ
ncbi:MAG TPA: hypothetical protein VGJ81_16900 [Thermoanaerobaculia bacterium]|jgi:hypothetical protein